MSSKGRDGRVRPRIAEFFAARHVLVTGATGFMGKVLVEKLLRSCPKLGAIYLLLRPKKGKDVRDRVRELLQSPLFDVVKERHPGLAERVLVPVVGDVSLPGLGLADSDRALLRDKVSVVFHGAATVRFDEPIKSAVIINVRGTRELAELAIGMRKLQVLVHVSTTYCNTDRNDIDEKVYPPHADWRKMIAAVESLDSRQLDILTPKLLQRLPNTYTFTKSLGEHCIYTYRDKIPLVIFRPSIVISTLSEPVPGWIDNFHGPVGLMAAAGKGLVHIALANKEVAADYMPVDIAIKAIIVAAWERATRSASQVGVPQVGMPQVGVPQVPVPIYNCSSAAVKPVPMSKMVEMARPLAAEVPFDDILWPPLCATTSSRTVLLLGTLVMHMLPALVIDTVLRLQGKEPRLYKLQRRIYAAQDCLAPFLLRSWTFRNAETLKLDMKILPEDCDEFKFDFREVNEYEYFRNVAIGGRRYLLKERDEDLPKAKAHFDRMVMIDQAVRGLVLVLALFWALRVELYMLPINVLGFLLTL